MVRSLKYESKVRAASQILLDLPKSSSNVSDFILISVVSSMLNVTSLAKVGLTR